MALLCSHACWLPVGYHAVHSLSKAYHQLMSSLLAVQVRAQAIAVEAAEASTGAACTHFK